MISKAKKAQCRPTILARFTGADGTRRLGEALNQQVLLAGNRAAIGEIVKVAKIVCFQPGESLMLEGSGDDDIYFILSGKADVLIKGRKVSIRGANTHVGEMALIDKGARRCASVYAIEETVVAKVSEAAFSRIANKSPALWRRIAVELGCRLRQRNDAIREKNADPFIFIACSSELLSVAKGIKRCVSKESWEVKVWTDKVFGGSRTTIETLEQMATRADFAVVILGRDDKVRSRRRESYAPRDNTILELGMFIGALSRQRTVVVAPKGMKVKIPTDLLGVTLVTYPQAALNGGRLDLTAICEDLRDRVREHGCK